MAVQSHRANYMAWLEEHKGSITKDYSTLGNVLYRMRWLRLSEFNGHRYADLVRLHRYAGKTFFTRHVSLTATNTTSSFESFGTCAGGGPFPPPPAYTKLRFTLQSVDELRSLTTEISPWSHPRSARLTTALFHLPFQSAPSPLRLCPSVSATRRPSPSSKEPALSHSFDYDDALERAYTEHGAEGVWIVLDQAWAEMFGRPPHLITAAMNPQEVAMRYTLLHGACVRVLNAGREYLTGVWAHTRHEAGAPTAVVIDLYKGDTAQGRTVVPVAELLDIHPYPVLGTRGLLEQPSS